ncbi:hypothetical protein [Macrococcus bovicus]|uniref:hypothetical protein n=1 Tax=Macrococcus bovicus TaxID=69968 RepID=UPI0025A65D4B|nr:hypothetical protein [Macrococcus bovicus]WJP96758.1 hypothetical protein QSV55_00160 [Macrococcus bovicus]
MSINSKYYQVIFLSKEKSENYQNDINILIENILKKFSVILDDIQKNQVTGKTCVFYRSLWAMKNELNILEDLFGEVKKPKNFDAELFKISETWKKLI